MLVLRLGTATMMLDNQLEQLSDFNEVVASLQDKLAFLPLPRFCTYLAIIAELVGPIGLAVGFKTRLSAVALFATTSLDLLGMKVPTPEKAMLAASRAVEAADKAVAAAGKAVEAAGSASASQAITEQSLAEAASRAGIQAASLTGADPSQSFLMQWADYMHAMLTADLVGPGTSTPEAIILYLMIFSFFGFAGGRAFSVDGLIELWDRAQKLPPSVPKRGVPAGLTGSFKSSATPYQPTIAARRPGSPASPNTPAPVILPPPRAVNSAGTARPSSPSSPPSSSSSSASTSSPSSSASTLSSLPPRTRLGSTSTPSARSAPPADSPLLPPTKKFSKALDGDEAPSN